MIRVIIADDHAVLRAGLQLVIDTQPDMTVVGTVADGAQVLDIVLTSRADVLILDLSLPNRGGRDLVRDLRKNAKRTAIVVLTMYPEDPLALHLLHAGAAAYLNKQRDVTEVLAAIRAVAEGGRYLTNTLAGLALNAANQGSENRPPHERLSQRESQVFFSLIEGKTVSEIAAGLDLTVSTVSNHVAGVRAKLGVASQGEILRYAHRVGLLGQD